MLSVIFGNWKKNTKRWEAKIIAKSSGISGFAIDPENGDVLMANHNSGLIEKFDK